MPNPYVSRGPLRQAAMFYDRQAELRRLVRRGLRLTLLLDEFQHLSANPNLELPFFNRLASLTVRYGLVWVVAVDRPLIELDRSRTHPSPTLFTSPFFTSFASLFLGLLPEEEARRLIREPARRAGVAFPSETVDFIPWWAGTPKRCRSPVSTPSRRPPI